MVVVGLREKTCNEWHCAVTGEGTSDADIRHRASRFRGNAGVTSHQPRCILPAQELRVIYRRAASIRRIFGVALTRSTANF